MRGSAAGSLVLMIGQIITTIISAVTIIWIAAALGKTSYGEYTVAFVPASLLMTFQDLGVSTALMRFCALYRHEGRAGLRSIVVTGLLFSFVTSLVLTLLLYFFSGPVSLLYLRPEIEPLIRAISLSILGNGVLLTAQAILAGYDLMALRSLTQVLFSLIRGIVGVTLILLGLGAFGATLSYTSSLVLTGLVSVILIFLFIRFEPGDGGFDFNILKMLIVYGFPLSVSNLLNGILSQVYSSMMILYATTDMIGNYGAAVNFGVLVSFLTIPIATALFPLFSKFKRDDPQLKTIFQSATRYTAMLTLPIILVLVLLAGPVSRIIYSNEYSLVPLYLSIYIITYAFEGLGGSALTNLISAVGESRVVLVSTVFNCVVGTILALILVPSYGIIGMLITMLISPRASWLYQIFWAKKTLGYTIDWMGTFKIYAISIAAFAFSYVVLHGFSLMGWIAIVVSGFCYLLVYVPGLPLSGALRREDFSILDIMVGSFGPLAPIAKYFLSILSRLVRD
jgi:O-antigen/teichoic acid export membrane protein